MLFLHLIFFPLSLPSYFYWSRKYLKGPLLLDSVIECQKKILCWKPFKKNTWKVSTYRARTNGITSAATPPPGPQTVFLPGDNGGGSGGGSDKRANRHILIANRLQATAIQWRLLLQQMDQRCAVRSKSGTLNNSATSPVTLTAV